MGAVLQLLREKHLRHSQLHSHGSVHKTGWDALDAVLPDGGLPDGVTELSAPGALGGTQIALKVLCAAHRKSTSSWCAWFDPEQTLYAPGLMQAQVDVNRLMVIRPPRPVLAGWVLKTVTCGAFEWVVVDVHPLAGTLEAPAPAGKKPKVIDALWVRRLSLACETHGTRVVLLTDSNRARSQPWPVSLRLELSRRSKEQLEVHIAKDRLGRAGFRFQLPLAGAA